MLDQSLSLNAVKKGKILLDSGAEDHVFRPRSFQHEKLTPGQRDLYTVSGDPIEYYGTKQVRFKLANGEIAEAKVESAKVDQDIFSVGCMVDQGHTVTFGPKECKVVRRDGVKISS